LSVAGYSLKPTRRSLAIAGGAEGMMGAMVGIHGPPISLIFQNAESKFARAMLGAFFSIAHLGAVAALAAFGLFGVRHLIRAGLLLPGVVVGLFIAPYLTPHIDVKRLRLIILAIAASSGIALLPR
jgi:uncharacterized protein